MCFKDVRIFYAQHKYYPYEKERIVINDIRVNNLYCKKCLYLISYIDILFNFIDVF